MNGSVLASVPGDSALANALLDRTIALLHCSYLRAQPAGFVLSRRQELPPAAFIPPKVAVQLLQANDRRIAVLSYGCTYQLSNPTPNVTPLRLTPTRTW